MDKKIKKTTVGNCPYCTRIIFKNALFNSATSFYTRCPHCDKVSRVIVEYKVEIIILPMHHTDAKTKFSVSNL